MTTPVVHHPLVRRALHDRRVIPSDFVVLVWLVEVLGRGGSHEVYQQSATDLLGLSRPTIRKSVRHLVALRVYVVDHGRGTRGVWVLSLVPPFDQVDVDKELPHLPPAPIAQRSAA